MMAGSYRFLGLFAVIPATMLLTISFFVLVVRRKIESQELKSFGAVIAVFLWLSASLVFSAGLYVISTGTHPMEIMRCPMMKAKMMKEMMEGKHGKMHSRMHEGMMEKGMETEEATK